jgi:Ca-activated chloride channel family protein
MRKMRRRVTLAAALTGALLLGASLPATGALAADSGAMMIVVDGSGSMAGLIEARARQSKIALVRDALRAALATAGPQSRIGLAAFGHRHGGCNDVELLRPPEPPDVDRTMAPFGRIKPRGKGAVTFALREAAKQLPADAAPRSLLLIHDGADNCQQDVCAAAAELGAAGIAAHVVSLGVTPEDLARMACLPQTTGGRHFKVDTTEQATAAIAEAVRLAGSELAAVGLATATPAGPSPWATGVVPAPVPATRPAALHLRALAVAGTEPLGFPLRWTVAPTDEPEMALFDAWAANPVVPVSPGSYVVTARSELVSASQTVTVRDTRTLAVPVVLGAGAVRVRVSAQRTAAPLADAIITVGSADGVPLAVFKAAEATALLQPGSYRVSAELGLVRAEQAVSVVEGRQAPVDIAMSVGRLQLTAAARDGAPPEPALFIVMEDDPPRDRREVARSAASQAEFVLPPGTYYVVARQGEAEARERLEIGAGDVVRRTLSAATGRLGLLSDRPG